jgi:hypothetical protein
MKILLVLSPAFGDLTTTMKKLFSVVALLAVVGTIVLAGCKPAEDKPTTPTPPDTNAPAPPK